MEDSKTAIGSNLLLTRCRSIPPFLETMQDISYHATVFVVAKPLFPTQCFLRLPQLVTNRGFDLQHSVLAHRMRRPCVPVFLYAAQFFVGCLNLCDLLMTG
jgi:hypothetical protein